MKKKKKKPGVRDLLKVLTKASAHIDDGSDKEITTTNDESEDDEVKPPTAIASGLSVRFPYPLAVYLLSKIPLIFLYVASVPELAL
jgi:hypothetical protein